MRNAFPVVLALTALACTSKLEEPVEPTGGAGLSYGDGTRVEGEIAYNEQCASCHDDGENGAPVVGDASQWSDRSPHWQAVLMEHAKDGYLAMPAKGGDPDIPDAKVMAAAQYMLSVTFPDRNPD